MQFLNNYVNCLQFNIRYEKVERPTPVGGALVFLRGRCGRDHERLLFGFTTTCVISAHHL